MRNRMTVDQYLNYQAIDLLEQLGNEEPTQDEIDLVERLLNSLQRETPLDYREIMRLLRALPQKQKKRKQIFERSDALIEA